MLDHIYFPGKQGRTVTFVCVFDVIYRIEFFNVTDSFLRGRVGLLDSKMNLFSCENH